jgi:orotidine-5'-phosphate decarboxylase
MAFFEELGPPGLEALANIVQYARQLGLLVILDGKRNDIGSTATAYARAYLGAKAPGRPTR